jgi:hypothetical protein
MSSIIKLYKLEDTTVKKITIDESMKRISSMLIARDYIFIGSDTILAVGEDKLISMI